MYIWTKNYTGTINIKKYILLTNVQDLSEEIIKSELEVVKDMLNKFFLEWEDWLL